MQRIILCPKCHVQVKKDNLGELLCPNCGARLCPKAHVFDGKICPYCGWEDPNYHLWQKAQKARAQSSVHRKPKAPFDSKPQYICPRCYTQVNTPRGVCPNQRGCGYSGPMQRRDVHEPATSATPAPMSKPTATTSRSYESVPLAPSKTSIAPPRSPILSEIAKAERREWEFSPLKRFIRPVLASLLAGIVLSGLVMGGICVTRLVSQNVAEPGTRPPPPPLTPSKTYTLSTSVIPEAGGEIRIVSPSSSSGTFEPGSQITLMAIPDDCYTFGRWEIGDALDWGETITITMDSNRSVTHDFKKEDTIPPVILDVAVVHAKTTDISATITWETDDEVTSQVEYGETEAYGKTAQSKSEPDTSDGFKYSARLTGLEPNTTYYFKVKVKDKCGNPETSSTKKLTALSKIPDGYEVGKRPPPFTLPSYQDNNPESPNKGQEVSLSDFKGKKILLNFWNTFCGACIGEFALIREIYEDEKLGDSNSEYSDLAVITICIDTRIEEAADRIEILEDKYSGEVGRFTFPILLDLEGRIKKDYHIWTIPYTVFIDSDGIIREIKIGRFKDEGEIIDILNRLD